MSIITTKYPNGERVQPIGKKGTIMYIRDSLDHKHKFLEVKWDNTNITGVYYPFGFADNHLYNVMPYK
jgi:hypothetical protein